MPTSSVGEISPARRSACATSACAPSTDPCATRGVTLIEMMVVVGLIAHLREEAEIPIGFLLAAKGEEAVRHTAGELEAPAA